MNLTRVQKVTCAKLVFNFLKIVFGMFPKNLIINMKIEIFTLRLMKSKPNHVLIKTNIACRLNVYSTISDICHKSD